MSALVRVEGLVRVDATVEDRVRDAELRLEAALEEVNALDVELEQLSEALAKVSQLHDRELARDDYHWSSVLLGIIQSMPFQMRRAPGPDRTDPTATTAASR